MTSPARVLCGMDTAVAQGLPGADTPGTGR